MAFTQTQKTQITPHTWVSGSDRSSSISIIHETAKAVLIEFDTYYFQKIWQKNVQMWVPKSVWNNTEKYFEQHHCEKTGELLVSVFNAPYWIKQL